MKEEVILNTKKLSEEEKRILEYSSAFEYHMYNLTGSKQYTFPKKILINELERTVETINNRIKKVHTKANLSHFVACCGLVLIATIAGIYNFASVIIPASVLTFVVHEIIEKMDKKETKSLQSSIIVRKRLITKVEEEYKKQKLKEALNTNDQLKEFVENDITARYLVSTVLKGDKLEINASSDVIADMDDKARNISDTAVETKTEEKTQDSPKQMIKGKKN